MRIKKISTTLQQAFAPFVVLIAISACGVDEENVREESVSVVEPKIFDTHEDLEKTLGLRAMDAPYCPAGSVYGEKFKLCVKGSDALGPFSEAMKAACVKNSGGPSCQSNVWEKAFASSLRGQGVCPAGTTRTSDGLCIEGANAFGPFSTSQVERCRALGGKEACETPRWSVAMARTTVSPPQAMSIPYLCQHQNVNRPSATCGNTSLAMALSAVLNKSVTADFLWNYNAENFGYNMANSRDKFAQVAKSLGAAGSRAAVLTARGMKTELDAGRLIVLQGRFTNAFGHIIVLAGYNSQGFIAYDPNGKWNGGATGSGYAHCGPTRSTGKGVVYSYADIESQSLLGSDYSVGIIAK